MNNRRDFLKNSVFLSGGLALASGGFAGAHSELTARKPGKKPLDSAQEKFIHLRRQLLKKQNPKQFLGYPINLNLPSQGFLDWQEQLYQLEYGLRSMNNVGDPFYQRSVYDSHYLEADLIERFAQFHGFDKSNCWGFVSNSGTDSNMHGVYIGKTLLENRHGKPPKLYYTEDAHYSIQIIQDLLSLPAVLVKSSKEGNMDCQDLARQLKENASEGAIIFATMGTTLKGAIDNLDEIHEAIEGHNSYLHLDCALFGGFCHFGKSAANLKAIQSGKRRFDSMSISCHKFFGFQSTAGLFFTHGDRFEEFRGYFSKSHDPAYITHVPGTISCSRDPLKPALFHYYCTEASQEEQRQDYHHMMNMTAYIHKHMQKQFPQLETKRFSEESNTLYFKLVNQDLVDKWTLAKVKAVAGQRPAYAHIVVMPHVGKAMADEFLNDLSHYHSRGLLQNV
ncbi:pyridoxal-dependent decarboxylase [Pseudoteredinibacter isoporae]|uniref:Histidine decarboxylase n=1 Tax=Pseudoteredinibacter isoporae TaxID=570281 RepID=A0A7X0JQ85_9GAMM|nr:pyridoxal-dependent decarboxylase [Pseudoteredinibacter isoporae]MBB6520220.1 histidine decarboxylase [Pseudoteredinibacter isoporae]NHO85792.1 histidine decarboxylase [Pseudoteredinibacter isoporae]NIB25756.1 histidine decarboxylase [Pseudoteredinibacter isoporae]